MFIKLLLSPAAKVYNTFSKQRPQRVVSRAPSRSAAVGTAVTKHSSPYQSATSCCCYFRVGHRCFCSVFAIHNTPYTSATFSFCSRISTGTGGAPAYSRCFTRKSSVCCGKIAKTFSSCSLVANLASSSSTATNSGRSCTTSHSIGSCTFFARSTSSVSCKEAAAFKPGRTQEAGMRKEAKASLFADLKLAPADPVLGLQTAYNACKAEKKVDLGVGAYRTDHGDPYVFKCVRKVEKELAADDRLKKEYLPIDGLADLKIPTQKLLFGEESKAIQQRRICSVQALSGTGGLRVAAEFIRTFLTTKAKKVYMSDPTWANHPRIFENAGLEVATYPYWNAKTRGLDFAGMLETLRAAEPYSTILLHACAHNPTGVDLDKRQWNEVLQLCKQKHFIPLIDIAYQGYATGSLASDRFSTELFCNDEDIEMFVCQSFAKNMGLYGERAGMLHIVCSSEERAKIVLSQVKRVIRPMYSNPPLHAARIACQLLTNSTLKEEWEKELAEISGRMQSVRTQLCEALKAKKTPGFWNHIRQQIGMFSYTGLTPDQCDLLTNKWNIFLMRNGRISLAGINSSNLEYVVDAIDDAVRSAPSASSHM